MGWKPNSLFRDKNVEPKKRNLLIRQTIPMVVVKGGPQLVKKNHNPYPAGYVTHVLGSSSFIFKHIYNPFQLFVNLKLLSHNLKLDITTIYYQKERETKCTLYCCFLALICTEIFVKTQYVQRGQLSCDYPKRRDQLLFNFCCPCSEEFTKKNRLLNEPATVSIPPYETKSYKYKRKEC